jgi:MFS family permease
VRRRILGRRAGFVVVAYAFAVTMLGTTLPTPLYPLYRERFGFSELTVTVVFATYALGVLVSLLLFGRLSDQIGRRPTLLPGLALSAASAAVFLGAHGLGLLFVGRVLSGLSAGIFTGTATAALLDLAPPGATGRRRATVVATVVNLGGLGCGPLLSGILSQYAGRPLRLPFVVDLALLVPAAVGVWMLGETVARRPGPVARPRRPRRPRVPAPVRAVFVSASLAGFAGFAVLGLFTAVAPAFLGEVLGVTNRAAVGCVVAAVFAASTVGQTLLGRLHGTRGLVVGCVGLIAAMGLLALSLAVASLALLVVAGVVAGLGQGVSFRSGLTAVGEAAPPEARAEVASAFFVVAYVAISLPVVGVGLLAQATTLTTSGVTFAAIVAALCAVTVALLGRLRAPSA